MSILDFMLSLDISLFSVVSMLECFLKTSSENTGAYKSNSLKRLRLGKTTGWQHRFFDLTILSPIWLGTYEYMKSSLENFFFRFETGLPEWIFQIWSKIFKSDQVFVYTKKSLF